MLSYGIEHQIYITTLEFVIPSSPVLLQVILVPHWLAMLISRNHSFTSFIYFS
jgi:hypothetical protein